MRLMKLMYTGQSRNGNTTPPKLISAQIGHRLLLATTASSGIALGWPSGSGLMECAHPQYPAPQDTLVSKPKWLEMAST